MQTKRRHTRLVVTDDHFAALAEAFHLVDRMLRDPSYRPGDQLLSHVRSVVQDTRNDLAYQSRNGAV